MKSEVVKPMSVARSEFIQGLTDLINSCTLPPFVIEEVLRDTYSKICVISKQQLENDLKNYQAALEAEASKNISV